MAVNLRQSKFHIGENAGTEATYLSYGGGSFASGVNVSPTLFRDVPFLLRFLVQETGGTQLLNVDFEFQGRLNGGTWSNITAATPVVRSVASILTNGGDCSQRLGGTGTFVVNNDGQTTDGTTGGANNDIPASGNSECVCSLQIVGSDVQRGDLIEFRLTRDGGTLLEGYDVIPAVTIPVGIAVATLKNRVAAIPAAQDGNRLVYDSAGKLLVISGYSRGSNGEHFYTVVREIDLTDLTLDPG